MDHIVIAGSPHNLKNALLPFPAPFIVIYRRKRVRKITLAFDTHFAEARTVSGSAVDTVASVSAALMRLKLMPSRA